jgi:hypothetical protein
MVFVPVLYFFFWEFSGFFSFPLSSFPLIITRFSFPILSFSLSRTSTSIRKIPIACSLPNFPRTLPSNLFLLRSHLSIHPLHLLKLVDGPLPNLLLLPSLINDKSHSNKQDKKI